MLMQRFLHGAGLSEVQIPEHEAAALMETLGQVFREVVVGLMEVLAARSSIKGEFRLTQTTIRPAENNPLKFSLGAEDAMAALLLKRGRGYLTPVEAMRESLNDIKAHQVAVLAGMQVALAGLLQRFDPADLEHRIDDDGGLSNILGNKKARYWDAFNLLYQEIAAEAEDDFHSLFGREFARAYEEQANKHKARR